MRRFLAFAALAAVFLLVPLAAPSARAEDPIPQLEKHPFFDAKPGEYILWENIGGGETTYMMVRVLGTKLEENKVFVDVYQTSKDGKELLVREQPGKWLDIPKFEATESQEFKRDEMVILEVAGKKLRCRHIKIQEQMNPPMPAPLRTREVWYSNEALSHGKVQELIDNPATVKTAIGWGMLPEEVLAKARKDYKLDEEKPADKPSDKPGDKPADNPGDKPADKSAR